MSESPESRLLRFGMVLPGSAPAAAGYVPCTQAAGLAFTSGQTPRTDHGMAFPGVVGEDVTAEQAGEAAAICALRTLAALRDEIGGLGNVIRAVKLGVYVRAAPGFAALAAVADGASKVVRIAFAEHGEHARTTVGVATLPGQACVEVEGVFLINPKD